MMDKYIMNTNFRKDGYYYAVRPDHEGIWEIIFYEIEEKAYYCFENCSIKMFLDGKGEINCDAACQYMFRGAYRKNNQYMFNLCAHNKAEIDDRNGTISTFDNGKSIVYDHNFGEKLTLAFAPLNMDFLY